MCHHGFLIGNYFLHYDDELVVVSLEKIGLTPHVGEAPVLVFFLVFFVRRNILVDNLLFLDFKVIIPHVGFLNKVVNFFNLI